MDQPKQNNQSANVPLLKSIVEQAHSKNEILRADEKSPLLKRLLQVSFWKKLQTEYQNNTIYSAIDGLRRELAYDGASSMHPEMAAQNHGDEGPQGPGIGC